MRVKMFFSDNALYTTVENKDVQQHFFTDFNFVL